MGPDPEVSDPGQYYFRLSPEFETSAPRHVRLKRSVGVATAMRWRMTPICLAEHPALTVQAAQGRPPPWADRHGA
ncbi:DUF3237 family protein [Azotobacter beijerinckii]|uniref:DUF3237 family protein n=1 Tax=Azotobacter beijerinckii TaxID=170623 RepID=UPI0037C048FC